MSSTFCYTTAIKKLRKLKKRIRGVPGGTSAGKTFGIIPILIDDAIKHPGTETSIVSETVPHLRRGALKDFLNIMRYTGRFNPDHYNATLLTYFFANGSYIEFFSADQESKVRGPRRHNLYLNECNNLSFDTYHQLAIRTSKNIWLDFNPSNEFWYHTELATDPDLEELILTYLDNEALSPSIVREIEKARNKAFFNPDFPPLQLFESSNIKNSYWSNWWRVYGLGMVGSLEGIIFSNWSQIDQVPDAARLIGYCIDFGYSNDPATLTACYQYNGKLVWDELVYQEGLVNRELAELMKSNGVRRNDFVVADCAEPKSIAEINQFGFSIVPADKGPDSVNFGIDLMQQDDFLVTKRSTNLIKELRRYMWQRDKEGKFLNVPVDAFNHIIDPMRYLVTKKISKRTQRRGIRRKN